MNSSWKPAQQWSGKERSAWRRLNLEGERCLLCLHNASTHRCQFDLPHFYERATEEDVRDRTVSLYRCDLPSDDFTLVRRVDTSAGTAVLTAVCTACAEGTAVNDVLCYYATLATGEVTGFRGRIDRMKGDTT